MTNTLSGHHSTDTNFLNRLPKTIIRVTQSHNQTRTHLNNGILSSRLHRDTPHFPVINDLDRFERFFGGLTYGAL